MRGTSIRELCNIENGRNLNVIEEEENCERMRAGGDDVNCACCSLTSEVYVIVGAVIVLVLGILKVLANRDAWFLLVMGIIILVLAIIGFMTKNSLIYLIAAIVVVVLAILVVVSTIFFILNSGFTLRAIILIIVDIIFIIFLVHLAYVAYSCRE
ncbi:hypothetical protein RB195_009293 [Necator americanus]|uniref:Uncharacterized protein n=1 Tax=Necator americanus TaxID=51031 RepID=A0ABR1CSS0_NECAM